MNLRRHRSLRITTAIGAIVVSIILGGCCCTRPAPVRQATIEASMTHAETQRAPAAALAASDSVTFVQMKGTHFRIDPVLALEIRRLQGRMRPLPGFEVIDFGDSESFVIDIASAEVALTPENMLYLFDQYVFNYPDAPLTLHAMSIDDGLLVQRGTLHKIVDIPFEMKAEVTATDDGRLRLHPVALEICNIPGQGLMDALGIALADLMDLSGADGMDVEDNDLLADPREFLPPPAIRGRVTDVRVEEDRLVQIFDSGASIDMPLPSNPNVENYMFFYGGTLAFGKLFMVGSDLQIVDEDPSDPFDFFLQRYLDQLVAGYSRTMEDGGLVALFPDYDDIAPDSQEVSTADE